MTVPARITLVTVGVANVARATAFYETLGWRKSSASTDDVSFFHTAGSVLALYPAESVTGDAGLPSGRREPGAVELAINVESEAEVDRVLDEVASAGGTILVRGTRADWGGYTGHFADLDGHPWEVAHNPGFPLREDGTVTLPE